ncbi:MAG: hypothetical protein EOP84_05565 [Verrucomicrobiaceae bacterium]|nr:MAG: hypothetical protein EOP84_05565 [Verrucomicrobiaceae bacterium]
MNFPARFPSLPCFYLVMLGLPQLGLGQALLPETPPATTTVPVAPVPGVPSSAPSGTYNQPVILSSFESVEKERLRLTEELAKSEREGITFREQQLMLQKKIASSSLTSVSPESVPTFYRTFLSLKDGDIERSNAYYDLLKSILNDLTPQSPYLARTKQEGTNPKRAWENLAKLDDYPEDEGLGRTLRGHLAEFFGGRRDDGERIRVINTLLEKYNREKKSLEYNISVSYQKNSLSGDQRGSDADRASYKQKIKNIDIEVGKLQAEKDSLSHTVTEAVRKLQYQQFTIELAAQQRYIHALIACGFYKGAPSRGDLSLSDKAYPASGNKDRDAVPDPGSLTPTSAIPPVKVPLVNTISGLETFLTNMIRDSIKDREAIDNMLAERQLSAAEALVRKMTTIARFQPELNTIPYSSRQAIYKYGQSVRALSDALIALNYPEITALSEKIEKSSDDVDLKDLKLFAAEQPEKARYLVRQAKIALEIGDPIAAQTLTDAAKKRAPMDPTVSKMIEDLQDSFLQKKSTADELKRVVDSGDYRTAYDRLQEFASLAGNSQDPEMKAKYENLVNMEKDVRAALEKCDAFERRSGYPDAWLTLSNLKPEIVNDPRLSERKTSITGKCPRFISSYTQATDHEKTGADALALAWYLTALDEAPGNADLIKKVEALGQNLIKH